MVTHRSIISRLKNGRTVVLDGTPVQARFTDCPSVDACEVCCFKGQCSALALGYCLAVECDVESTTYFVRA